MALEMLYKIFFQQQIVFSSMKHCFFMNEYAHTVIFIQNAPSSIVKT